MNIERLATVFVGGVLSVAILTTILARSNTPRVFDSIGRAGGNLISSALGRGVGNLR